MKERVEVSPLLFRMETSKELFLDKGVNDYNFQYLKST